MNVKYPSSIREEELKNKIAADFFGAFDCTRIVGNIDFCVSPKRRDPRQMTFVPEAPILWAEAKNHPTDVHRMLAQLILTIKGELKGDVEPPRFVGCFDSEKIAFVEYHYILPVFNLNDFNWTQTPSSVDDKTVETVRGVVPAEKIVVFRFGADDAEIKAFIARNFTSGESPALATPIDRNNFTFIYQKWRAEVMPHIDAPWDVLKKKYALYDRDFFLAEMNVDDNGTPEVVDDRPAEDFYITFDSNARDPYTIRRKTADELNFNLVFGFKPDGLAAYASFWRRYKRPPKREYWDFIVSRLDLLVPQDVRERKGSFFTPAIWVEKSQQYLADVLGENWQDEYYVWDCAGGTGNLEVGLMNKYRIWVSTLDQQDVDVIRERIKNGANLLDSHVFRFDFLNDSFDKLPQGLKEIVADPVRRRKLVIYINPPYAEAGDIRQRSGTGQNKTDVSVSHSIYERYVDKIGLAGRELFALFLMRIHEEIPDCIVGQFSKLKHLQSPNFKGFREAFTGRLEKCFLVPADTFDNVKGKFPIGFFVWRLGDNLNAEEQRRREIREFLEGDPVARLTGHEFEGMSVKEVLNAAHDDWKRVNHQVFNPGIGIVSLTRSGLHDTLSHGRGRCKISALQAIPEIVAAGRVISYRRNWKNRGYDTYILVAPVAIGGIQYVALVIVNCSKDINRFYLHEVGCIDDIKKCAEVIRTGFSGEKPALSRNLGDVKSVAYSIFAVNGVSERNFTSTIADVYDREGALIGSKMILAYDDMPNIGKWVNSFRHDNGLHLGFMSNGRNDFQNTNLVYFINDRNQLSTPRGWWITPSNLIPMCIFVAVRHSVEATWLNDRDTFLYPNDGWSADVSFQMDCIIYALFSDFNVIKSSVGMNHWIPFTEEEVGAKDCFKSHFMSDFINGRAGSTLSADAARSVIAPYQGELDFENVELCKCENMEVCKQPMLDAATHFHSSILSHFHNSTLSHFSPAARAVLDAGRELWRYYHAQPNANPNASYYDIRLHFQGVKRTASGKEQMNATSSDATYNALLANLRAAHKTLAAQIALKVYEYGFLRK